VKNRVCNTQPEVDKSSLLQNYKNQELLPLLLEELQEHLVRNEKLLVEFQQQKQDWNTLLLKLEQNLKSGTADVIYDEPLVGENIPPVQLVKLWENWPLTFNMSY
jgi:hypothetical protein